MSWLGGGDDQMSPRERFATWLVFLAHVVACGWVLLHHEPWRDEADVWLMSRDASLWQILKIASHSGTPSLIYFLVKPFAALGLPFQTYQILNFVLCELAVWLLLFRAPLPFIVRVLVIFWHPLGYEYPIIARNYALGCLLLFATAHLDARRLERPLAYGLCIALLANASAHFFLMAGVLGAALGIQSLRRRDRASWASLGVAGAGILAALAQLWPRPGGQFPDGLVDRFRPEQAVRALHNVLFGGLETNHRPWMLLFLALALLIATRSMRAVAIQAGMLIALGYVFAAKYLGWLRHHDLILIAWIFSFWIAQNDPAARTIWSRTGVFERCRRVLLVLLVGALSWQQLSRTIRLSKKDLLHAYSGSQDAAKFILAHALQKTVIAAWPAAHCSSVLAHLPPGQFFYPGIDAFGSHMFWDAAYIRGQRTADSLVLKTIGRRFPDEPPVLLVCGRRHFSAPPGYRTVYITPFPVQGTDEVFSIAVPE